MVTPDPLPTQTTVLVTPASGRIDIVIGTTCRVIVDAGVDTTALSRVLDLLERR